MLVRNINEKNQENKIFRGEVIEKVDIFSGICRILLKDAENQLIYCLVQGLQWIEKIKDFVPGKKIILAPSKIFQVPLKHKSFYAPDYRGLPASNLYFHYNSHDFDLGIYLDCSIPCIIPGFYKILEIFKWLDESTRTRCSVIGILVDFYIKNAENTRYNETYYRLKIIDDSITRSQLLTINLHLPKIYALKNISLGDIVVAQNPNFSKKQNYYTGAHNRSSGSFAILSWCNCKVKFCLNDFILSENIISEACRLQNWLFDSYQHTFLGNPSSLKICNLSVTIPTDIILFLVHVIPDFPEPDFTTCIFSDAYAMGYLSTPSVLVSNAKCENWVKLNSVRAHENQIELTENTSIIMIPFWSSILKVIPPVTSLVMQQTMLEFNQKTGKDSYLNLCTRHSQELALDNSELLNVHNKTVFTKIKALIIEFQPRNIGTGVLKKPLKNAYSYHGLVKIWRDSEIFTIFICGRNSDTFYGISEFDNYSEIVKKVQKVQDYLGKGYGWVEFGVKRVVTDSKVILALSETEIKS